MSSTVESQPEVVRYLDAVRGALADLPPAEREDLLAEVELSVADAAADEGSVAARLGPAEDFAAELRAAAGLTPAVPSRTRRLHLRALVGALRSPGARRLVHDLAPVWWVARGYVAVAFVGVVGAGWSVRHAAVPSIGDGRGGVLAIAVAVIASVCLGLAFRDGSGRTRLAIVAANALLVVAAVPVVAHLDHSGTTTIPVFVETQAPLPAGLFFDGASVTNIYAFDRTGRMLHDVLLYDSHGNPLNLTSTVADPNRRLLHTSRRYAPIYNSFPIRYYEPGTTHVAHPDARPSIAVPKLAP